VIRLPERYHKKFSSEIIKLEEEHKMPYVTSWERIAKKEGKREGKKEGKREGKEEEQREVALKMLQDGVSIDKIASYTGLTEKKVKELLH
jgi:predicted transposase/invertase (TIGR01784 family)